MMSHKSVLENRRNVNKDSRLKDKDLRLEFKHKNQGLSTLSAFFHATNTKSCQRTGVVRILCIIAILFICCIGQYHIA